MRTLKPYIGGSFELDLGLLARPAAIDIETYFGLGPDDRLMASGRGAFRAILRKMDLDESVMLIPDYLCGEVIVAALEAENVAYRFYPVSAALDVPLDELESAVTDDVGAILLINYFGLSDLGALAAEIRSWGSRAAIVLDNVQALYDSRAASRKDGWADYSFASFRKFLSLPDGAFARGCGPFAETEPAGGEVEGTAYHVMAAALRHGYLNGSLDHEAGAEETYLRYFEKAAAMLAPAPAPMSAFSRELMARLPLDEFADSRRRNYAFVADALAGLPGVAPLIPDLPEGAVPMALPVLVADGRRDALRLDLRNRGIFCAVHWPLTDALERDAPPARLRLAREILSLPIDQRYGTAELGRLVESIHAFRKAA